MIGLMIGELRKLMTTRLWIVGLVGAVLSGGGLVGILALSGPENAQPPLPGLDTADGARLVLGFAGFAVIVPALIGAVMVTAEYRHRTITTGFLAVPRRWPLLVAKLAAASVVGLGFGLIAAGSAGAAVYLGAAVHGQVLGLPPGTVVTLLARVAAAMAAYTVLGVGVGALLRNQTLTLGVLGGYLYMGELALLMIPGVNLAYPFLPGGATAALTGFSMLSQLAGAGALLPAAGGALVMAGWAALAAGVATVLPLRRDVT